jgi:endonuclease YncB( thermonuclease family)
MIIQDNYTRHIYSIESIHDGDTVKAIVESGFNGLDRVTFRLDGINTAEVGKKNQSELRMRLSEEAKAYVIDKVENHKVRVVSEKFKSGGYGRYLGVIYYEQDGDWHNLNQELLDLKLAQTYYPGASKETGDFKFDN